LDAPVVLSKTVVPVCLPPESTDPDQYADQDAIILGWDGKEISAPCTNWLLILIVMNYLLARAGFFF
jgi:hypothetical protein